jgi:hypothetical protein
VIDISHSTRSGLREDLTGGRVDDVECLARLRGNEFSIDKKTVRPSQEAAYEGKRLGAGCNLCVHIFSFRI